MVGIGLCFFWRAIESHDRAQSDYYRQGDSESDQNSSFQFDSARPNHLDELLARKKSSELKKPGENSIKFENDNI